MPTCTQKGDDAGIGTSISSNDSCSSSSSMKGPGTPNTSTRQKNKAFSPSSPCTGNSSTSTGIRNLMSSSVADNHDDDINNASNSLKQPLLLQSSSTDHDVFPSENNVRSSTDSAIIATTDTDALYSRSDDSNKKSQSHLADTWNEFLYRNHKFILFVTLVILFPLGMYSFSNFIASTDSTIHPIPNSLSDNAIHRFRRAFSFDDSSFDDTGNEYHNTITTSLLAATSGLRSDDPLNPGMIILLEHHNNTMSYSDSHSDSHSNSMSSNQDSLFNDDTNNDQSDTFIDGSSNLYQLTQNYTFAMENYLFDNLLIPSDILSSCFNSSLSSSNSHIIQPMINVTSYYSLQNEKLYTASTKLTAMDGHILLLYVSYSIPSCIYPQNPMKTALSMKSTPDMKSTSTTLPSSSSSTKSLKLQHHNIQRKYTTAILSNIQTYTNTNYINHPNNTYNVSFGYTGITPFQDDMSISVKKDIRRMHRYILPLSLILLCFALHGHLSIVIIPIITVGSVVCSWSLIMIVLVQRGYVQVTQFTPNVMISLSIGLGIDYTLFLLSRVLSEICSTRKRKHGSSRKRKHHKDRIVHENNEDESEQQLQLVEDDEDEQDEDETIYYDSIAIMIRHAGHTILISGITLMSTFLGLLLFPIHSLQSISIGASVCIICCLVMNLTIIPSILHSKIGRHILILSRPEEGGSGMNVMKQKIYFGFIYCKKKFRIWRFKSRLTRMRLNSASSLQQHVRNDSTSSSYKIGSTSSSLILPNNGHSKHFCGKDDDNDPFAFSDRDARDESYTCFQELLLENEISKERQESRSSVLTTKHSNGNTHHYTDSNAQDSFMSEVARIPDQGLSEHFDYDILYDEDYDENNSNSNVVDMAKTSIWYRLCEHLLHPQRSLLILIGIVILLAPIASQSIKMKTSISFELMLPSDSTSLRTFHRLGDLFGEGNVAPYRVLVDGMDVNEKVDTVEAFDVMHKVIQYLERSTINPDAVQTNETSVAARCTGIAWANGAISHTTYTAAKTCYNTFSSCPIESFRELIKLDSTATSQNGLSTIVTCIVSENPYADDAIDWLVQTRQRLKYLEDSGDSGNYTISLEGGATIEYDAQGAINDGLYLMIGVTFGSIFLLVSFFFRAIVPPLRSAISTGMTLLTVYGLIVLVYQKNDSNNISWLCVPMSFSIIVGLGLDYDVFLINRILEYRLEAYDHKSSIVAGLYQTGSIITAAGLIMAVSFGGLMFSPSPAVYQWSFSLTTAVLVDTFIMRTCVVPILLHKTGKFSWYPRKLPNSIVSLDQTNDEIVLL